MIVEAMSGNFHAGLGVARALSRQVAPRSRSRIDGACSKTTPSARATSVCERAEGRETRCSSTLSRSDQIQTLCGGCKSPPNHALLQPGTRFGGDAQACGMKWTVKLVVKVEQGETVEREIGNIEREDQVSPASLGPTIAEGKRIMEGLQKELVTAQMSTRWRLWLLGTAF